MAHNFQRPNLPYEAESLQNDKRYQLLTRSNKRPATDVMLDTDFDYLIDAVRQLDADIASIEAGNLQGSDDPDNAGSLVTTDGEGNIGWVKIQDSNVEDESISSSKLIPGTITANEISNATITGAKIAATTITGGVSGHIAVATITGINIVDDTITSNEIGNSAITAAKIASNAVTTAKILDANVTTAKILDANVTTGKLASNAVTTAKILDANVTAGKLASNAVTTAKILDANVTAAKIANDAITFTQINSSFTATKAQQQAAVSASVYTSPSTQQFHPSAASFWCYFDGTLTGTNPPQAAYNVTSVTRNSAGNYTINYTNNFSSSNYCVITASGTNALTAIVNSLSASSCNIVTRQPDVSNTNQQIVFVVGYGTLA